MIIEKFTIVRKYLRLTSVFQISGMLIKKQKQKSERGNRIFKYIVLYWMRQKE